MKAPDMKKDIIYIIILLMVSSFGIGLAVGLAVGFVIHKCPEPEKTQYIINDWYEYNDGIMRIRQEGYFDLTKEVRDSIEIDAILKI